MTIAIPPRSQRDMEVARAQEGRHLLKRAVVALHNQGMSFGEIAEAVGCTRDVVAGLVRRAKAEAREPGTSFVQVGVPAGVVLAQLARKLKRKGGNG